jgi:hypothetical protein
MCDGDYDENTTEIDCDECQNVTVIPDILVNLEYLFCGGTNISKIPGTLVNLITLNCTATKVKSIPETLTELWCLVCVDTNVTVISNVFTGLHHLYCTGTRVYSIPEHFYTNDRSDFKYDSDNNYGSEDDEDPPIYQLHKAYCPWLDIDVIQLITILQRNWRRIIRAKRTTILEEYMYKDVNGIVLDYVAKK